jgi:hypothetical protein
VILPLSYSLFLPILFTKVGAILMTADDLPSAVSLGLDSVFGEKLLRLAGDVQEAESWAVRRVVLLTGSIFAEVLSAGLAEDARKGVTPERAALYFRRVHKVYSHPLARWVHAKATSTTREDESESGLLETGIKMALVQVGGREPAILDVLRFVEAAEAGVTGGDRTGEPSTALPSDWSAPLPAAAAAREAIGGGEARYLVEFLGEIKSVLLKRYKDSVSQL